MTDDTHDRGEGTRSNSAIDSVLNKIVSRRLDPDAADYDLTSISDAIEELFAIIKSEDISGYVEQLVKSGQITVGQGVLLLGIAAWSGNENGRTLQQSLNAWLEDGNDRLRVQLALGQDVYPFSSFDKMKAALGRISDRYPEFADRCSYLINTRPRRA